MLPMDPLTVEALGDHVSLDDRYSSYSDDYTDTSGSSATSEDSESYTESESYGDSEDELN